MGDYRMVRGKPVVFDTSSSFAMAGGVGIAIHNTRGQPKVGVFSFLPVDFSTQFSQDIDGTFVVVHFTVGGALIVGVGFTTGVHRKSVVESDIKIRRHFGGDVETVEEIFLLEGHRGSVVGLCPYSTWFRFVCCFFGEGKKTLLKPPNFTKTLQVLTFSWYRCVLSLPRSSTTNLLPLLFVGPLPPPSLRSGIE